MTLQITTHTLGPGVSIAGYNIGYSVVAKRYYNPQTTYQNDDPQRDGATLIFAHATGFHKECFEPIIFKLLENGKELKIREAWSFDCPNHGEAAVVNDKFFVLNFIEVFPWEEYGRAIGYFLTTPPEKGGHADFTKRRLYAMAHSMGAVSLCWLHGLSPKPVHFKSFTLIEPMIEAPGTSVHSAGVLFVSATYVRKDTWPSSELALKEFESSRGYKRWDRNALQLFAKYGLRTHPAASYEHLPFKGVTLACSRVQEAACYRGNGTLQKTAVPALAEASRSIPIHLIWGTIPDSVPIESKRKLADTSISDIKFKSIHWVQDAGHLVVQHSPLGVAEACVQALRSEAILPSTGPQAKL